MIKKVLAIIPARAGSKRIPKKNIKPFYGKPMIAWPISVLQSSSLVSDIIVSTDDDEIINIAEGLGVKAPFVRPEDLSDDYTGTTAVTKHAVEWYIKNIGEPELILTVYPTAVFMSNKDIWKAYKLLEETNSQLVFAGTEFPFPIQRAVYLDGNKRAKMFYPENFLTRSQDLTPAYHDAGQFYLARKEAVLKNVSSFSDQASILVLPRHRVVDIDTMEDFITAERLFSIGFDN
jgi:pseudaminic acid cytidylyltransferase